MACSSGIALCFAGFAGVAVAQGRPERAARLFGAAEALRAQRDARFSPPDDAWYARRLAAASDALDAATWSAEWEVGRAMTVERAIRYALELQAHLYSAAEVSRYSNPR